MVCNGSGAQTDGKKRVVETEQAKKVIVGIQRHGIVLWDAGCALNTSQVSHVVGFLNYNVHA